MTAGARTTALLSLALLASCGASAPAAPKRTAGGFPVASRPVSSIVSSRFSNEADRDTIRESARVMDRSGVKPGMTVADIGAGEGYYTVRLAQRVGPGGRVLAEDIFPEVRDKLAERVSRERLDNVSVRLGEPADPKLPAASFDRIFLVHMYHEIAAPYELLWRMRPALRAGGRLVIVDADRPTDRHGTPPALLDCELRATGYSRVSLTTISQADAYIVLYEAVGARPEPAAITACAAAGPQR